MSTAKSSLYLAIKFSLGLSIAAQCESVELADLGTNGFKITGINADDRAGMNVSGIGDVNGDGLGDVLIGAKWADPNGVTSAGESYVVFGKRGIDTVELGDLGEGGFTVQGFGQFNFAGTVSGAGDVNGDGLADIIIGAHQAAPDNRPLSGESYVIFGKTGNETVVLDALGPYGVRIKGASNDISGASVSGAGDVNGDGFADLLVGASYALNTGSGPRGTVYVIFGKSEMADIDLALGLGDQGFRINGEFFGMVGGIGGAVSGAGDVNGDGLHDIVVGAGGAGDSIYAAGRAYVVFGKTGTETVELETLGSAGFRVDGIAESDFLGGSVSGAGDVNGDGFSDLVLGVSGADPGGRTGAGQAQVVFGPSPAAGGFVVNGIAPGDRLGRSVSGLGDINGDGLSDLLIGADLASPNGATGAGASYVIFGKADQSSVELSALGSNGFSLNGIDANDFSGHSVSGVGDVNGDGLADLLIGAYGADNSAASTGESYVVFSTETPADEATYLTTTPPGENLTDYPAGIISNGSDDHWPSSRTWLRFDGGATSLTTITLDRSTDSFSSLSSANTGLVWEISTSRQTWTSVDLMLAYTECQVSRLREDQLEVVYSQTTDGTWTSLDSLIEADRNRIRALALDNLGFFAIADTDLLSSDGFETSIICR
ncbi:MAG: hypothetical protein DHS20C11_16030 [Lysobacteraceae bacterium]|nr:MAG: hypothetical protein DHS20C11_16030 [Xanthomonadaceae bacterium]